MAPPSKTIMDHERESRMRDADPIGYAIRKHNREHHNGFLSMFKFSGVRPSRTMPPRRIK